MADREIERNYTVPEFDGHLRWQTFVNRTDAEDRARAEMADPGGDYTLVRFRHYARTAAVVWSL